jgi:hypothetical protein
MLSDVFKCAQMFASANESSPFGFGFGHGFGHGKRERMVVFAVEL